MQALAWRWGMCSISMKSVPGGMHRGIFWDEMPASELDKAGY